MFRTNTTIILWFLFHFVYYCSRSQRFRSIPANTFNAALQVWKNYVCDISPNGICVTTGRLTPTFYSQMAAGLNISYGLYRYGPFLVDLQDCTFVRQTFTDINRIYCPGLRRYSSWIYIGLVMVATAVMLSLLFWVIYGRERKHRVYTKEHTPRFTEGYEGDKPQTYFR